MKAKTVVLQSNKVILQAFVLAALAFVFSTYANAASSKIIVAKKTVKAKKQKSSVMFVSSKQRKLLAQNSSSTAADAKLEGEFINDSIPVAAPAESSLVTKVAAKVDPNAIKFGARFTVSTSTSVAEENDRTQSRSYTGAYVLNPSVSQASSGLSGTAEIELDREYTYQLDDGHDTDWVSPSLKLRKTIKELGLVDSLSFGPTIALAAGREAKRQTFQGSLGAAVAVEKTISIVTLSQALGYTYRLYEYDIRADGTVNSPSLYSAATGLSVQVTKWLSLGAEFTFQHLVSFQKVNRSLTSTVFQAGLTPLENAAINFGIATLKKGTLQEDGQSNRVNIYDPGTAQAFLDLVLSF